MESGEKSSCLLDEFLRDEGLGHFVSKFAAEEMDLQTFLTLTADDLTTSFGITHEQDMERLLEAVDTARTKYNVFVEEASRVSALQMVVCVRVETLCEANVCLYISDVAQTQTNGRGVGQDIAEGFQVS